MYHDPLYWKALGEFIELFANTELALYVLLRYFAKIPYATGNALFPGLRAKVMMERITRLLEMGGHPKNLKLELKDVFSHMTDINDARNGMIHYASMYDSEGERIVTDKVRRVTGEKRFHVSPEIISLMINDLYKISFHCGSITNMPGETLEKRAIVFPVLANAWQYKHEPNHPKKDHKKNR